jgi:hypothetical protein
VVGRSKREAVVEKTGEVLTIVNYRVLGGDVIYQVDAVNPEAFIPLDTLITLPVKVRAYTGKNGAGFSLSVKKEHDNGAF